MVVYLTRMRMMWCDDDDDDHGHDNDFETEEKAQVTFATLVNVGLRLICFLISGNVVYLHGFISTHCVWQCVYFF